LGSDGNKLENQRFIRHQNMIGRKRSESNQPCHWIVAAGMIAHMRHEAGGC
jgi:hypothetical protein